MDVDLSDVSIVGCQSQIFEYNYLWSINNFSFFSSEEKEIRSITSSNHAFQWYCDLIFHSSRYSHENREPQFIVTFNLLNTTKPETSVRSRFSILNSKNKKAFTDENTMKYSSVFRCPLSVLFENCNELLPNDTLTIYCEVISYNSPKVINDVKVPCCRLSDDYKLLFDNEKHSDVTLFAEGTEFRAHKAILAARSSVFQAMFEDDSTRLDIIDINPEVLRELLRFIYTGEVMGLKKMAADILVAADKYALDRLKAMCEKELCSKLMVQNVLELLTLANRHNATQLKANAIGFLGMHSKQFMGTPEWEDKVLPKAIWTVLGILSLVLLTFLTKGLLPS